ncbi:hypothetical protein OS493_027128 [Desmophyllum pertusum]|uniref:TLDc domain-containing protein n=1 Tax=Desmophyllum pertusum TaxID=174260 RepID=A0A9W9ZY84_9CNID|nr:hypothetical protein OS493_027128 [Desmophyllum pertusum]
MDRVSLGSMQDVGNPLTTSDPDDYLQVDLGRLRGFSGSGNVTVPLEPGGANAFHSVLSVSGDKCVKLRAQRLYINEIAAGGWKPLTTSDPDDYLQVDLGRLREFQGGSGNVTVPLEPVVQNAFHSVLSGQRRQVCELRAQRLYINEIAAGTSKLWGQYNTEDKRCYTTLSKNPLKTEWTRVTFVWKDNSDTRMYMDSERVNVGAHLHPAYPHVLNSAKICVTSRPIPHVSGRLGTGRKQRAVCRAMVWGLGLALRLSEVFIYTWSRPILAHKVTVSALRARNVVSSYRCVTFRYHMFGKHVGRLNVFVAKKRFLRKPRLETKRRSRSYLKRWWAMDFLETLPSMKVKLLTESCSTSPNQAKAKNSTGPSLEKSAIVGHLSGFKLFLLKALADTGKKDRIWVPCYRALTDGKDVREFYKRCAGRVTLTIVRVENYIFGGYTDKDWSSSLASTINQGTDPKSFYLKTDRRHSAHFAKSDQGPTFGDGDLVLETMSSGYSELGNSFDIGADAAFPVCRSEKLRYF